MFEAGDAPASPAEDRAQPAPDDFDPAAPMDFAPADLEDLESWVTDQYTRTLSRYA
jgi:hypothetical protein